MDQTDQTVRQAVKRRGGKAPTPRKRCCAKRGAAARLRVLRASADQAESNTASLIQAFPLTPCAQEAMTAPSKCVAEILAPFQGAGVVVGATGGCGREVRPPPPAMTPAAASRRHHRSNAF